MKNAVTWNTHKSPTSCKPSWNSPSYSQEWIFNAVILGYNNMEGTEYVVSLWMIVVESEGYDVTVNSDELIGTTDCVML